MSRTSSIDLQQGGAAQGSAPPSPGPPGGEDNPGQTQVDLAAAFAAMTARMDAWERASLQQASATQEAGNTANLAGNVAQQAGQAAQGAGAAAAEAGQAAAAAIEAVNAAATTGRLEPVARIGPPPVAPVRPPKPPKFKGANKYPRVLEWAHLAENYLRAANLYPHGPQAIWHISTFLEGDAMSWWRLYSDEIRRGIKPDIGTWEQFRDILVETFQEFNHETEIRDRYQALRQTGSVAKYTAEFRSLVVELKDETEAQRVYQFLKGLKSEIQARTRTQKPTSLTQAMDIADEADRANTHSMRAGRFGGAVNWNRGRQDRTAVVADSGPRPMQVGAVRQSAQRGPTLSEAERQRLMREERCFKCKRKGHLARECRSSRLPTTRRVGMARAAPSSGQGIDEEDTYPTGDRGSRRRAGV